MDESPYTKTHGSPSPQYRIGGFHGVNTLFSWISRSLARNAIQQSAHGAY